MKIFFCFVCSLLCICGYSQVFATIEGKVVTKNGLSVENCEIRFIGDTILTVYSDADGKFKISDLNIREYTVFILDKGEIVYEGVAKLDQPIVYHLDFITNSYKFNDIEEIIVQGSHTQNQSEYVAKMPLKNIENPQVYTTITKEIMNKQMVTTSEEALKNVPGGNNLVQGPGSGGVWLSLMMRGFNTDIGLRNGLSTNLAGLTDMVNVERLEVVKGPSGTLFGSIISYGGMINKITKKPYDKFRGAISYTTGSWGLSRLVLDINSPIKDTAVLFRINTLYHTEDYFQEYAGRKTWAIDPGLTYLVNDHLTLNFDLELFQTSGNTNFYSKGNKLNVKKFTYLPYNPKKSLSDKDLVSDNDIINVFAEAKYKISNTWISQTLYSFSKSENKANYLFLTFLDNENIQRKIMKVPSTFNRYNAQQNFIGKFNLGRVKNEFLAGIDYLYYTNEDKRSQIVYDEINIYQADLSLSIDKYNSLIAAEPPFAQYSRKHNILGIYVSDVVKIKDRLNLLMSLRMDYYKAKGGNYLNIKSYNYDDSQTSWSPKFGLVYEIIKDNLSFFGNYMDGFSNVVDTSSPIGQKKSYKPEHANQWEGGVKLDMLDHKIVSTISYYDIKVKNSLRTVSDGTDIYTVQDGTRKSKGIEVEIKAALISGWNIFIGYGYNDSRYKKANASIEGKHPYNTPYNSFNFWTDYALTQNKLKGVGIGMGMNSVGKSFWDDVNTFIISGYTTLDMSIFYNTDNYKVSLKMNNITDKTYWTSSYWAQPQKPRQILASLSYNF